MPDFNEFLKIFNNHNEDFNKIFLDSVKHYAVDGKINPTTLTSCIPFVIRDSIIYALSLYHDWYSQSASQDQKH